MLGIQSVARAKCADIENVKSKSRYQIHLKFLKIQMSDQRKNKVWHFEKVNIVLATMSVGKLNRFPFVDSRFKKSFRLKGGQLLIFHSIR